MRKFIVVALLALPVLALTQQRAAAWCKFGFGVTFATGGKKFCWDGGNPPASSSSSSSTPCCCPAPCCPAPCCPAPGVALPPPAHAHAHHASYVQPVALWQQSYAPADYYGYGNTGYTNYSVPSYWYGYGN